MSESNSSKSVEQSSSPASSGKRVFVPVLGVVFTLLIGVSSGFIAWRLRKTDQPVTEQPAGAVVSPCEQDSTCSHIIEDLPVCGEGWSEYRVYDVHEDDDGKVGAGDCAGAPCYHEIVVDFGNTYPLSAIWWRMHDHEEDVVYRVFITDDNFEGSDQDISGVYDSASNTQPRVGTPPGNWQEITVSDDGVHTSGENCEEECSSNIARQHPPGDQGCPDAPLDVPLCNCSQDECDDANCSAWETRGDWPCALSYDEHKITFSEQEVRAVRLRFEPNDEGEDNAHVHIWDAAILNCSGPIPPLCQNLTAIPESVGSSGGEVTLTGQVRTGWEGWEEQGEVSYQWGVDGGNLSGHEDSTPTTATWTLPPNTSGASKTYYAYLQVTNERGSSGCTGPDSCSKDGAGCVVPVKVEAGPPENDLSCDDLTITPANPEIGDSVSFTCTGTSKLAGSDQAPYPITRVDFQIYLDKNEDGLFHSTELVREGSAKNVEGKGPSWTAEFTPSPSLEISEPGLYAAASRVCIDYEGQEQCTPFALQQVSRE